MLLEACLKTFPCGADVGMVGGWVGGLVGGGVLGAENDLNF